MEKGSQEEGDIQAEGAANHLQSHLEAARRALGRMNEIIEDVLTLTWGSQKIGGDSLEGCSIEEVARASWEHVDTARAELHVLEDRSFWASKSRLRQIFENLFRNAVEHGGEEVTVRVGVVPGGFYVEDDGPGVSPERREEIFEIGTTSSEDGTGLGLSITETIAKAHGWSLSVLESREGGARFEVTGVDIEESALKDNLKG